MLGGFRAGPRLAAGALVGGLLAAGAAAHAQVYVQTSTASTFVPLAALAGITDVTDFAFSSRDEGRATLNIPFDYRFIGSSYTELSISVNSQIVFGALASGYFNRPIGTTSSPNNMIAVWWDDLILPNASGHASHGVIGTAPNRIFVIEVRDWEHYPLGNLNDGRHQVWLYEGPEGRFEVHYDRLLTDTEDYSATVGWEGPGGTPFGAFLPCTNASPYCGTGDYAALSGRVVRVEQVPGPDLQGAVGAFGRGARPGQTVSVPVTLRNVGTESAAGITSELYLSTDSQLDLTTDIRVATFVTPTVDVGAPADVLVPATVPLNTPPGDYYLLLAVDTTNAAAEPNEQDNEAVADDRFGTASELTAVAVSAPGALPGETMQVDLTIESSGLPFVGSLTVGLQASVDRILGPGDHDLGRFTVDLTGVASEQVSATVVVPATLPPGGYYLFATLDPDNLVDQLSPLADEVASVARFPTAPDFAPTLVSGPLGAVPGSQITFDVQIDNLGLDYAGLAQLRAIASTDPIYDLNDVVLGQGAVDLTLAAGQSRTVSLTVTLPALRSGRYFPILLVDPNRAVPEVDEYNNNRVGQAPFATGPDLEIRNIEGPGMLGAGEVGTFTVRVGSLGSPFDGVADFDVYLSADDQLDPQDSLLGSGTAVISNVPERQVDVDFTMPALPPGDYRILARVDPADAVAEADEVNNVYLDEDEVETGPDFNIYSVAVNPRTAVPGDVVEVTATVRNYGGSYTGPVEYVVYYSEDYNYDPQDIEAHRGTLQFAGEDRLTLSSTFAIAADALPGEWDIVVVVNPNGLVPERERYDNEDDGTYDLVIEGPNPTVTWLGGEALGFAGRPYTLEVRLVNSGAQDAVGVDVSIVLSGVGVLTEGNELVRTATTTVVAGGQVNLRATLEIPSDTAPGFYLLGTIVDPDGRLLETDERDNLRLLEGGLEVMVPSADLRGRIVTTATRAAPGEAFSVQRHILNTGIAPAPTASVRYVLSADDVIGPEDIVVHTSSVTLGAGQDDVRIELIDVPESVTAGRYRLGMVLDAFDAVPEIDETNNTALGPWMTMYEPGLRILNTQLPDAVLDAPYEAKLFALGAIQETGWSVVQGSLPPGIILDQLSGELRGTAREEGTFSFTVQVRSGGPVARRTLSLTVVSGTVPLRFATLEPPPGSAGRSYLGEVLAVGGRPPYRFTAQTAMPPGLVLQSTGAVRGTPTLVGAQDVRILLEDVAGTRVERTLTFVILRPDHRVRITQATLPVARVGEAYCGPSPVRLLASGGTAPYRWTATSTTPPGLALAEDGSLCGVPSEVGEFGVQVRVQDAAGTFDTAYFEVEVATSDAFVVRTQSLPEAEVGRVYEAALVAVGGEAPLVWSLELGALPEGLSLDPVGRITGTPAAPVGAAFALRVQDARGQSRRQPLALLVRAPERPEDGGCRCVEPARAPSSAWWGLALGLVLATRRRRRR